MWVRVHPEQRRLRLKRDLVRERGGRRAFQEGRTVRQWTKQAKKACGGEGTTKGERGKGAAMPKHIEKRSAAAATNKYHLADQACPKQGTRAQCNTPPTRWKEGTRARPQAGTPEEKLDKTMGEGSEETNC